MYNLSLKKQGATLNLIHENTKDLMKELINQTMNKSICVYFELRNQNNNLLLKGYIGG